MVDKVNVIIPTFNEKENLKKLIRNVSKYVWIHSYNIRFRIIDDTKTLILKKMVQGTKIQYMKGNGNYGDSLITGILRMDGMGDGCNKVIIMDIDHPFNKIPDMIHMLDEYDMVIGNDLNGNNERRVTKFILKVLFGINVPHPTCGFMGFTSEVIGYKALSDKTIRFYSARSKKDVVHVEFLYMGIKNKLKIGVLDFDTSGSDIKHKYSMKRSVLWLYDIIKMAIFDVVDGYQ